MSIPVWNIIQPNLFVIHKDGKSQEKPESKKSINPPVRPGRDLTCYVGKSVQEKGRHQRNRMDLGQQNP